VNEHAEVISRLKTSITKIDATDLTDKTKLQIQWLAEQRYIATTILYCLENGRINVDPD
jgi:hypothetical protein